uniref:Uncharacterized protein n=1 Tax=Panagrolaimus superbus TaxID=310955 RepID=A0A914YR24_9BILA
MQPSLNVLTADTLYYDVPSFEHELVEDENDPGIKVLEHSKRILRLATANAIVILIFMVLVLVASSIVTALIYYHYSNRARRWVKITKTMHQRLSKQILREEKLVELCQKIAVSAELIHGERKEICPDIGEMVDLPAVRYVDPFKAPSNLYEQIAEKDEDAKTLKNIDPDVFIKKDDIMSSGGGTTTNPSGKTPVPATPATPVTATAGTGGAGASTNPPSAAPPPAAPTPAAPTPAPITPAGEEQKKTWVNGAIKTRREEKYGQV